MTEKKQVPEEYEEASKPSQIVDKVWEWVFKIVALLFFIWWLFWWDHMGVWSDKTVSYPVKCSKNYKDNECLGEETLLHPINYMINKERAEVVVMTSENKPPQSLTQCSIFDNENWKCPGRENLPSVYFADGLQQSSDPRTRFISQWRYRFIELRGWF